MRAAAVLLAFAVMSRSAGAGAWTLDQGHMQVIQTVTQSSAARRYDDGGSAADKTSFAKLLVQNISEIGLTDAVTLFAAPEYVTATIANKSGAAVRFHDFSVEGGARILLFSHIGMVSVQGSYKTAGAFDMSTSAGGQSGTQIEARLLYGRSFKFWRRYGFIDVELARRWVNPPRPCEYALDLTTGWWLSRRNQLLLQSFNLISTGSPKPPYESYRMHKLQASLVYRVTARWSLQSGYFATVSGRNMVQETGFTTALWYKT